MQSLSSKENFFIGLSLANTPNYDSAICVIDRFGFIKLIDKFYFASDIEYFFETSPYVKNSIICANVPWDNKILEGKWRIHTKNYKMLGDYFKINRNNWTERVSKRCNDVLVKLFKEGIKVIRTDVNRLRSFWGLAPYYLNGTSTDCKNLQTLLKLKFDFLNIQDNMLSASALEAIMCSIFAIEYINNIKTSKIFEIDKIPILVHNLQNN